MLAKPMLRSISSSHQEASRQKYTRFKLQAEAKGDVSASKASGNKAYGEESRYLPPKTPGGSIDGDFLVAEEAARRAHKMMEEKAQANEVGGLVSGCECWSVLFGIFPFG